MIGLIGLVPAHLACLVLVAADMLARALRIRLLVSRLGARLSFADAVRVNLLGDGAAELTPFRIAGEPARAGALLQAGIRTDSALLAVGAEFGLSYGIVAVLVIAASWATLPAWWSSVLPALGHAARIPLWLAGLLAAAVALSLQLLFRVRDSAKLPQAAGIRPSIRTLAGIRPPHLAVLFGLTLVNIAARVGILWVLVSALPGAPGSGTIVTGSFLLLFGQAFAPTPSGVGVVELGVLGGVAGPLGDHALSILFAWRVYTAIVPIVLAVLFAVPRFGVRPLIRLLGLQRGAAPAPLCDVAD